MKSQTDERQKGSIFEPQKNISHNNEKQTSSGSAPSAWLNNEINVGWVVLYSFTWCL